MAASNNAELPALDIDEIDRTIPLGKIIELRNKGLTYDEIGKLLGCSKQNINQRLQPVIEEIEHVKSFKEQRADVLAVHQSRILNRLTTEDIEKASGYQKVGMFSLLYDKERVERTGLTQTIGYVDMSKAISAVNDRIKALQEELGVYEAEIVDTCDSVDSKVDDGFEGE